MADDAFALSPISARASLPTEADYEAICTAFMETARGRWFLGEYAKRNRNADTRMVLDAVERIEATLATQKAAPSHSLDDLLPELVDLISDARHHILEALPKTDIRPSTEPIQRAASVLRDVAWTLRESGADTRVCDLLDVQAKAIADACARMHGDQAIAPDIPAIVAEALDSLSRQINALIKTEAPAPRAPDAKAPVDAERTSEARQAEPVPAPVQPVTPPPARDAILDVVAPSGPGEVTEPTPVTVSVAPAEPQPAPESAGPLTMVEVDVRANLWEDLEIIDVGPGAHVGEPPANEAPSPPLEAKHAEPTPVEPEPPAVTATVEKPVMEPPALEAALVVRDAIPEASAAAPEIEESPANTSPPIAVEPQAPPMAAPSSLGQAALESGVVAAAPSRFAEALAPIRRMSQAEKIAFFS